MKYVIAVLLLWSTFGWASEKPATKVTTPTTKVYSTNKYGQTEYHKGYLKIQGNKAVEVNKYGQTQYHKPKYKIKD